MGELQPVDFGIDVSAVQDIFSIVGMFFSEFKLIIFFGLALLAAPRVIGLARAALVSRKG